VESIEVERFDDDVLEREVGMMIYAGQYHKNIL
jgi:hypothetical protein